MKKYRAAAGKTVCALLCLTFICCYITFAEEEPAFAKLWNAGYQLAFETENTTLSGNAEFYLDGEWFKTYSVGYMQDGICSYLLVRAQTPQDNGSTTESGYEVLAQENGDLWVYELNKPYYSWGGENHISSPVISSRYMRRAADAAQPFVLAVLPAMLPGDGLTVENTAEGENLRLSMKADEVPAVLQQMMLPLLTEFTEKYFEIKPGETADVSFPELSTVYYEDSSLLRENVYAELYGKELPQDWHEEVNALYTPDDNGIKPADAVNAVISERKAVATAGGNNFVYLYSDGTAESFATRRELSEAAGQVSLVLPDLDNMVIYYTEQKTGKPADENLIPALILWDWCPQLREDFNAVLREIREYYTSITLRDEKAIGIQVKPDLDYVLLYNDEEIRRACSDLSTARYLIGNMDAFSLGDTDVRFTLDREGRLTGVVGSFSFPMRLNGKYEHTVEMRFSCRAENYGETDTHSLTPDIFEVPEIAVWYEQNPDEMANEYYSSRYWGNGVEIPQMPFTVEFYGKEYTIEKPEATDKPDPYATTASPKPLTSHAEEDTLLYFNPEGGRYYHIRQDCPVFSESVQKKLMTFPYAERFSEVYGGLKPCPTCGAPE